MSLKSGDFVRLSKNHIKDIMRGLFDREYHDMAMLYPDMIYKIEEDETRSTIPLRYRLIGFESNEDWCWKEDELELVTQIDIFSNNDFLL